MKTFKRLSLLLLLPVAAFTQELNCISANVIKTNNGTWGKTGISLYGKSTCKKTVTIRVLVKTYSAQVRVGDILEIHVYDIEPGEEFEKLVIPDNYQQQTLYWPRIYKVLDMFPWRTKTINTPAGTGN